MECGKLTAKLRDAVPICLMVDGKEVKRYKNIEIPEEIKRLPFIDFKFDVPPVKHMAVSNQVPTAFHSLVYQCS